MVYEYLFRLYLRSREMIAEKPMGHKGKNEQKKRQKKSVPIEDTRKQAVVLLVPRIIP